MCDVTVCVADNDVECDVAVECDVVLLLILCVVVLLLCVLQKVPETTNDRYRYPCTTNQEVQETHN